MYFNNSVFHFSIFNLDATNKSKINPSEENTDDYVKPNERTEDSGTLASHLKQQSSQNFIEDYMIEDCIIEEFVSQTQTCESTGIGSNQTSLSQLSHSNRNKNNYFTFNNCNITLNIN